MKAERKSLRTGFFRQEEVKGKAQMSSSESLLFFFFNLFMFNWRIIFYSIVLVSALKSESEVP